MPRKTLTVPLTAAVADNASMRPRPDAAENHLLARQGRCAGGGFNEAAARCRGKPSATFALAAGASGASMRPRPDAAENRAAGERAYDAAMELQ